MSFPRSCLPQAETARVPPQVPAPTSALGWACPHCSSPGGRTRRAWVSEALTDPGANTPGPVARGNCTYSLQLSFGVGGDAVLQLEARGPRLEMAQWTPQPRTLVCRPCGSHVQSCGHAALLHAAQSWICEQALGSCGKCWQPGSGSGFSSCPPRNTRPGWGLVPTARETALGLWGCLLMGTVLEESWKLSRRALGLGSWSLGLG